MSTRESQRERPDLGPDPVYGLGMGIVGLVVTAVGGALTWHYTFNVGQGIMLLGAAVFLTCGLWTELKHKPLIEALQPLFEHYSESFTWAQRLAQRGKNRRRETDERRSRASGSGMDN